MIFWMKSLTDVCSVFVITGHDLFDRILILIDAQNTFIFIFHTQHTSQLRCT